MGTSEILDFKTNPRIIWFIMKQPKKQWKKPQLKVIQLACECTAYVDAE
jgi:hypothetical protein